MGLGSMGVSGVGVSGVGMWGVGVTWSGEGEVIVQAIVSSLVLPERFACLLVCFVYLFM